MRTVQYSWQKCIEYRGTESFSKRLLYEKIVLLGKHSVLPRGPSGWSKGVAGGTVAEVQGAVGVEAAVGHVGAVEGEESLGGPLQEEV